VLIQYAAGPQQTRHTKIGKKERKKKKKKKNNQKR
jgi:hypothetical protein